MYMLSLIYLWGNKTTARRPERQQKTMLLLLFFFLRGGGGGGGHIERTILIYLTFPSLFLTLFVRSENNKELLDEVFVIF